MTQDPFNITSHFFEAASKFPEKIAIADKKGNITFGELEQQVIQVSNTFLLRGIKKGDRVLVFVPMSIELYRTVLALFRIGAVAVFLDEWVSFSRLNASCKAAKCHAFIGSFKARILGLVSAEIRKIPIKLGTSIEQNHQNIALPEVFGTDTALLTFTTGSTGSPKAARRTHGFLHQQFLALSEEVQSSPEDIDMPVLPIVLLLNLGAGCTSVIAKYNSRKPSSLDPSKILNQIEFFKVTKITASPFFVLQLARYIKRENQTPPQLLRKIFTGGAPVFPNQATDILTAFSNTNLRIVYGSTEAEPISSISGVELIERTHNELSKGLPVGLPFHRAKVRIITIDDHPVNVDNEGSLEKLFLPAGTIGEIIVSGSHVLSEYFNNEEAIRQNKIFVGDKCWHRTGDSGYLDSQGNLFLCGRCKSLIVYKGELIAPFIYEFAIKATKEVEIGTVLLREKELVLVIETTSEANREHITNALRQSRLQFDYIHWMKSIPRDPRHHSKIDYEKLKMKM